MFPILNDKGVMVDFKTEGEYPVYGNDDARVDSLAQQVQSPLRALGLRLPFDVWNAL